MFPWLPFFLPLYNNTKLPKRALEGHRGKKTHTHFTDRQQERSKRETPQAGFSSI
jgi:hypothetical protein